jgi:type I restriction enzyme, S subunit
MSFPRYPEYKKSGVEWLGEVPGHWAVPQIKRTTYLKARVGWKGLTSEEFREKSFAYLVTGSDFREKFVKWDACYQVEQDRYEDDPFIQLKNGDLLITKDGTIGKLAIVSNLDKSACLNSGIFVVRPLSTYTTEFMYWVLSSSVFSVFCDLESFGSTINHLYQNVFEQFTFPAPPESEQTQIAAFLDRETAKIDALVAEQRRLMALLKKKRQAVISHAVTRGLNPHAPMKPSGVEWLGDVPGHWEVIPLRWAAKVCSGDGLSSTEVEAIDDDEHTVKVIGGNGLMGYTNQPNVNHSLLAVGRVGALCGNVHLVHPPAWITDNALVLDPVSTIFDLRFLSLTLRSRNLNDIASKTAQPLITGTQVSDQRIPCPPLPEQDAIAKYLTEESSKFDTLTTEAQRAVDLLQERRTALISAAVTGQIDVRAAVS